MDDLAFSRALEALWRLLAEANQYLVDARAVEADQGRRGRATKLSAHPVERPRGGADRGDRPAAVHAASWRRRCWPRSASADAADEPRRPTGVGRHADQARTCPSPRRSSRASTRRPTWPSPTSSPRRRTSADRGRHRRRPARSRSISIDQFFETELKVATVTAAERVPKSEQAAQADRRPGRARAAHGRGRHRPRLQARGAGRPAGRGGREPPAGQAHGRRVAGHGAGGLDRRQAGPAPSGRARSPTAPGSSERRAAPPPADRLALPPAEPRRRTSASAPSTTARERGRRRASSSRPPSSPRPRTSSPLPPPSGRLVRPGSPSARRLDLAATATRERLRVAARRSRRPWRWGSAASTSTTTTRRATAQLRVLREQWELAIELGLPVVVHNRDSNDEMLAVVRERGLPGPPGRLPLLRRRPGDGPAS